jgi:hypothetical protein
MADCYGGFGVTFNHGQQMSMTPEIMAFAFDEFPWYFPGLIAQLLLLFTYPTESGNGVSPGYLKARIYRGG